MQLVLAAVGAALLIGGLVLGKRLQPPSGDLANKRLTKFTLEPELTPSFQVLGRPVPSPDGRNIAFWFRPSSSSSSQVIVWDGERDEFRSFAAERGQLFWSPDSRKIGQAAYKEIRTIDLESGAKNAHHVARQGRLGYAGRNMEP